MPRHALAVLAAVLVASLALPAVADEDEDGRDCYFLEFDEDGNPIGPEFCTLEVWMKENDLRVGNLGALDLGLPTWDTEEPASVTTGAGGMYVGSSEVDLLFEQSAEGGATFEGEFTGNIDTLAVDLYAFFPFLQSLGGDHTVRVALDIAGLRVWSTASQQGVPVEWLDDGYGVIRFLIPDVHDMMGWASIPTGSEETHTLRLNVSPWFIPNDDALYVYGAAEAPTGIVFNIQEGKQGYTTLD